MAQTKSPQGVRQAELLACLSLAIDLGLGLPAEVMMRTALLSVRLAQAAGLPVGVQRTAYFLALIRQVGCTATALVDGRLLGDERQHTALFVADFDDGPAIMQVLQRDVGAGLPAGRRAAMMNRLLQAMGGGYFLQNHFNHCEGGAIICERLGLGPEVQAAIWSMNERWNGKGTPHGLAGEDIDIAARLMHLATLAAHFGAEGGVEKACEVVAARSGRQLDPGLVRVFLADAGALLEPVEGPMFAGVLAAEPGEPFWLDGPDLEQAFQVIADFTDHKLPELLGHSRRVAALAAEAGRRSGLPAVDLRQLECAGLVHDIGRVGITSVLLNKTGKLTASEWERIRLHPYLTERIFTSSPALAPVARLASTHHERLDGSGYHRGLSAAECSAQARILQAANAFAALTEGRPHRPALTAAEASSRLTGEAREGRLDRRAVEAVLAAAGEGGKARRSQQVALSDREVEVLRLLARQHSNKAIARELGISPKTVEHHISHIFDKTGCTTRTGAALYATHNALL